ncbi:hypothetical protein C5167_011246 [Papaver somniferum]|uniref:Glycolipid transfer protein domain-containing protein n=1 Tax=Papaver somniferum TaxID=3469 RepID=A0A4Y7K2F7_PAPSO|nr:glycolipid transfer protein 3-like [Papaver somniferum]RZC67553.1 hypothetical protein C5167_011246 [Papaver somniferum]
MENGSEIRSIIEELCLTIRVTPTNSNQQEDVSSQDHKTPSSTAAPPIEDYISTKHFLRACNLLLLQPLDKVGPSMLVLRQDVHQNIERLEKFLESDPSSFGNVVEILKKEATEKSARKVSSCTRALVWLTRSLDFAVALLDKLVKDQGGQSMKQAVEESYNISLRPWHGWISSAAYRVALKLVPERKTFFINLLMADQDQKDSSDLLTQEIKSLTAVLSPLLDQIHSILMKFNCHKLKTT